MIAIEFLKDGITNTHQKEIIDAVNEYDYLKEYKGLILFDESLPIPPGCDPNKSWDFSTPTAHLHLHKLKFSVSFLENKKSIRTKTNTQFF